MARDKKSDNRDMDYLRVDKSAEIIASLNGGLLSASRFKRDTPGLGMTGDHVQEDAFMLAMQLVDYSGALWVDGKTVDFGGSRQGNFTLYDYSRIWRADLQSAFDCVNFHIPKTALLSLEEDIGPQRLGGFNVAPGVDVADPIVRNLVHALVPIFDGVYPANQLLLDSLGTGLLVHLASRYGTAYRPETIRRGGLTPLQLRRATELLDANLDGQLKLSDIASECGLSVSYFAKAFKMSTGRAPHGWLIRRRIARANDLLKNTTLSIREIAVACGFADQAHFTRVFGASEGITPAALRRDLIKPPSRLTVAPA